MSLLIFILLFIQGRVGLDLDFSAPLFSFLQFFVVFFIVRWKQWISAKELLIQIPLYIILVTYTVNILEEIILGLPSTWFAMIFPIGFFNTIFAIAGVITVSLIVDFPLFKSRLLSILFWVLFWTVCFVFAVRPLINYWLDYKTNPYWNKTLEPQALTFYDRDSNRVEVIPSAQQPTILFFWTSWCVNCKPFYPIIEDVYKDLQADNWQVYLVNYPADEDSMNFDPFQYMYDRQIRVPVLKMNEATAATVHLLYYPYMLVYVDDSTVLHGEPSAILSKLRGAKYIPK